MLRLPKNKKNQLTNMGFGDFRGPAPPRPYFRPISWCGAVRHVAPLRCGGCGSSPVPGRGPGMTAAGEVPAMLMKFGGRA